MRVKPNPDYPTSNNEGVIINRIEDSFNDLVAEGAMDRVDDFSSKPAGQRLVRVIDEKKLIAISEGKRVSEAKSA